MTQQALLQLQGISKSFTSKSREAAGKPLWVLRDIDLIVEASSTIAIVGPSGSGKSTLMSLSAGLERPSTGSVAIDGVDLSTLSEDELSRLRLEKIGFVFQAFFLIPSLTALENVMVPGELQSRTDSLGAARELLAEVGLGDRIHHYPSQLSGGEQQRVALARAFLNRPKLLFADEPTGNLDEETATRVEALLFELQSQVGTALVIATHNMELAEKAGRVLRLRHGRIEDSV